MVNAAYSPIGRLIDQDPAQTERALDLNCRTPLLLAHQYLPVMAARGRGGLIIMSSLAGLQGTPSLATYAATKAFGAVLAEGLWAELRGTGVDVLACVAGAVATPGLDATMGRPAPGTLRPERVAEAALGALGRRPRTVPGTLMRASAALMARPPFWRMTIWIDVLYFGPFYLAGSYAFLRGRDWIRVPALVWSGLMLANVLIILMEERYGAWATPQFGIVLALNLPWLLLPAAMIWRMRHDHPFTTVAAPAPTSDSLSVR